MNYVFFKCLNDNNYDIHIFDKPLDIVKFFHIRTKMLRLWRNYYDINGYSIYPRFVKGYTLVFLEAGSEEKFFETFSKACIQLTDKLNQIVQPLILAECGEDMYNKVSSVQCTRQRAINLIEWLSGYVLAPRSLLYSRGFTFDELIWLQAYVGRYVPTTMPGLKKLKY